MTGRIIEAARRYWVSIVAIAALGGGALVLVASQGSSDPARAAAAASAAWNRKLAAIEAQSSREAAQATAADAAVQRSVARDNARQDRQDNAMAAQAGEADNTTTTTPAQTSAVTTPAQTAVDPSSQATVATTSTPARQGTTSTGTSPVAAGGGGPIRLTASQVRAAEQGTTDMLQECLDESKGNYGAAGADVNAAVKGMYALKHALQQDADTRYQDLTGGSGGAPVTMRQLAALAASPSDLNAGGGCALNAENIQTALNGLPR